MMRVLIRGVLYESVKEAAAKNGVTTATVYDAVTRGDPERIGLGRGFKERHGGGKAKRPVTIGPVTFESMKAADRALGYTPGYTRQALFRYGKRAKMKLIRRVMEYHAKQEAKARKEREQ